MEGGPLYNLEEWLGMARPERIRRRAFLSAFLTFLPLLILAILQRRAVSNVEVPFVRDFSTYSRFILAVPLLLFAENVLGPRIAVAAAFFVSSGLVPEKDYARFNDLIDRGLRARDSVIAEIILVLFSYAFAIIGLRSTAINASTWYLTRNGDTTSLTWAGWWLIGFCAPLFQFLFYRWLWRLFLWFQFLSRVRHLDLQLFPTHPDEAGGLGFVGETQRLFGIILFAMSIGTTGVLANEVVYDKVPLSHFNSAIAAYVVIAILVLLGPLSVFGGLLMHVKRIGLHQYGALATAYTGAFHRKWIRHEALDSVDLLGTGDIQSLADLGNSYNFIEKMKPLPIDLRTVLHLVVSCLVPLAPLLLAVVPLKDLLRLVVKIAM